MCDWCGWDAHCEPGQCWASWYGDPYLPRKTQSYPAGTCQSNFNPGGSDPCCTSPGLGLIVGTSPQTHHSDKDLPTVQMNTSLTPGTNPGEALPPARRRGGPEEAQRESTGLSLLPQHSAPRPEARLPHPTPSYLSAERTRAEPTAGSLIACALSTSDETVPDRNAHRLLHKPQFRSQKDLRASSELCGPGHPVAQGAEAPAAHTSGPAPPCRTAHVSHSQGGWLSHGPFLGDPDTRTQPPVQESSPAQRKTLIKP